MSYKIYSISLKRADTSVTREQRYAGVVQWQNTSLPSWIRGFDSHHPLLCMYREMCLQLSWIEQRPSKPWVGGSNPFRHAVVGIAQLVSAPDCGSGGPGFESLYPPFAFGLSPSGKAQHFDCCIRWFESSQPSLLYGALAQSVEHLTFNQVVRGSNPRCFINSGNLL